MSPPEIPGEQVNLSILNSGVSTPLLSDDDPCRASSGERDGDGVGSRAR